MAGGRLGLGLSAVLPIVVVALFLAPAGTVGLRATPTLVNGQVGGVAPALSAASTRHAQLGVAPQVNTNREGGSLGAVPSASGPGNVTWTLCLMNGQLLAGNAVCPNGISPTGVAVDSQNGYLYVVNGGSNNVSVINGATNTVIGSVQVGTTPGGVAYDGANGYLYVANHGSKNVSVLNGVTDTVVGSVPVGNYPSGVGYDSGNGYLYVANELSDNVSVINGATDRVVGSIPVGYQPVSVGYDSGNGYLYVINYGSNNVSVISDTTNAVVATVPVGSLPVSVAYDSGNRYLYVANDVSNNVSVINGVTDTVVGSVPVGSLPEAVGYDSGNGYLYVANWGSNDVSVINGATDRVVGSIPVGINPSGVGYDSGNRYLYVANALSNNVSVMNGATDRVVGSIPVGIDPSGVGYDSGNGYLYMANSGSNNVSVINGVTDRVVGSVPVGNDSQGVAYDSGNGYLYVANYGSNDVSVINGATDTVVGSVPVGTDPYGVGYDSGNGYLYVANAFSDSVSVINGATDTVVGSVFIGNSPRGVGYDNGNGYLYVANYGSNDVSVINGATDTVVGSVPVGVHPVSMGYDSGNGYLYVANYGSNDVSVINGATDTVVGAIPVESYPEGVVYDSGNGYLYVTNSGSGSVSIITNRPGASTYPATFSESGLPAGTSWSITLAGQTLSSTTGTITFNEPNGSYPFTVGSVPGYTANITSGSVTVNGGPVSRSITFTPASLVKYSVTFTEKGLPAGTIWLVYLNGATNTTSSTTVSFREPNGTYGFGIGGPSNYAPSPSSGTVTVTGAGKNVNVTFTRIPYSVTFTESGLPSGTPWNVTMNKTRSVTASTQDVFYVNNGTFNYTVGNVSGYAASPSSGSVLVKGHNVTVPVTFVIVSPGTYVVTFSEGGLPSGMSWSVTLNGILKSSTTSDITFSEPNGTYSFTVSSVPGYTANITSGSVTINGASKLVSITFTPSTAATYAVTFSESGLPSGTSWSVTLSGSSKSGTGSQVFTEPNGSYPFTVGAVAGYTAAPSSGSIPVNGVAVSKSVTFTVLPLGQYSLIFSETGLPTGTNWSVTVGSTTRSSTASTISFTEVNGTYHYSVGAVSGYTSAPSSGNVTVNGAAKTVAVTFSKSSTGTTYAVTFTESGLSSGMSWSVTLSGSTLSSTTSTITFQEANGSYTFTVGSVSGYTSSLSSGTVKVNGGPASQSVTFSKTNNLHTGLLGGFLGLPGYEGYILVGVIVAAVAAGVAILLRRKRAPPRGSGAVQDSKNIADGAAQQVAVE